MCCCCSLHLICETARIPSTRYKFIQIGTECSSKNEMQTKCSALLHSVPFHEIQAGLEKGCLLLLSLGRHELLDAFLVDGAEEPRWGFCPQVAKHILQGQRLASLELAPGISPLLAFDKVLQIKLRTCLKLWMDPSITKYSSALKKKKKKTKLPDIKNCWYELRCSEYTRGGEGGVMWWTDGGLLLQCPYLLYPLKKKSFQQASPLLHAMETVVSARTNTVQPNDHSLENIAIKNSAPASSLWSPGTVWPKKS